LTREKVREGGRLRMTVAFGLNVTEGQGHPFAGMGKTTKRFGEVFKKIKLR
jgi:hypothetical protein